MTLFRGFIRTRPPACCALLSNSQWTTGEETKKEKDREKKARKKSFGEKLLEQLADGSPLVRGWVLLFSLSHIFTDRSTYCNLGPNYQLNQDIRGPTYKQVKQQQPRTWLSRHSATTVTRGCRTYYTYRQPTISPHPHNNFMHFQDKPKNNSQRLIFSNSKE